jgi:hypothetical protein
MQALGALQMVHVAFSDQGIVGSLSFILNYPDQLGQKLNTLLDEAPSSSLAADLNAAVLGQGDETILDINTARAIAARIAAMKLRGYSLSKTEAELFTEGIRSGLYLSHTGGLQVEPEIGDLRSVVLIDTAQASTRLLHHSSLLHLLAVQLKSTAEASVLSDTSVMKQVAARFSTEGPNNFEGFSAIASQALALALDLTNSDAGAIYLISTKPEHSFVRVVAFGSEDFPTQIPRDKSGSLATAIYQNLAIQRVDWLSRASKETAAASPDGIFLLTPIGGPEVDPGKAGIGALVLRRDDRTHAFSAYDLALIRYVTLRISLARTTEVGARIGSVTSALQAPTDWLEIQERVGDEPLNPADFAAIPTDVRIAARRIAPALADLAELTDSSTVSLRLVLPSADAKESHGLALVMIACHPGHLRTSSLQVQTEDMGGTNWKCIHENTFVYSPDVAVQPRYLQYRADTVSDLAVPVREAGQLIGVLSLESPLNDAYGPILPLITSFASAIGRTLADARASLEVSVVDDAAQVLNHRHTMESRIDRLKQTVRILDLNEISSGRLDRDFAGIQSELKAMRSVVVGETTQTATIPQVLERAADEVSYLGDLPGDMWMDRFAKPISGAMARALQVVITNILSNIMNYSAITHEEPSDKPVRAISMETAYLANRSQIVVHFQNYANGYVSSMKIADLYRCPVADDEGRVRLGGFLAGINARRAHARLQAVVLHDGRTVRTTLVVPIED